MGSKSSGIGFPFTSKYSPTAPLGIVIVAGISLHGAVLLLDVLSSLLASLDDEGLEVSPDVDVCDLSSVKDVSLSDDEGLEVFVSLDDDVLVSLDVELCEFEELSDLSLDVLVSLDDEGLEVSPVVLSSLDVEPCDLSSVKDVPSLDVDEFVELSTTSIGLEVS